MMKLREEALLERARQVLGVPPGTDEDRIRYAYYRRMFEAHPDRHPDNPLAHEMTALINEAFALLTGKRNDALLLMQDALVSTITQAVATEMEGLLSYEEWVKQHFYDIEGKSIYAC